MARGFTPANSSHVLLVEGQGDKDFFNKICALFNLTPNIQVATPTDFNGKNSKEGVINNLPQLLKQLADGSLSKLAVIFDADYKKEHGLGCQETIKKITEIVKPYDFVLIKPCLSG
jgi:hypothetical protein